VEREREGGEGRERREGGREGVGGEREGGERETGEREGEGGESYG